MGRASKAAQRAMPAQRQQSTGDIPGDLHQQHSAQGEPENQRHWVRARATLGQSQGGAREIRIILEVTTPGQRRDHAGNKPANTYIPHCTGEAPAGRHDRSAQY